MVKKIMLTVAEAGRKGGKARLKTMTAEQRQEVARMGGQATSEKRNATQRQDSARRAAQARWAKQKKQSH